MKKSILNFLLGVLLFGSGTLRANPLKDEFQTPAFQVGDTCTHVKTLKGQALQPLIQKVVQVSSGVITTEARTPSGFVIETWQYTRDGNPRSRQNNFAKTAWEPHVPYFRWPAKVGDRWEGEYSYPAQGGGSGTIKVKANVAAYEKVTVPAGSFETLKIVLDGRYEEANGGGRRDEVIWYAPSIRCIVKSTLKATRYDGTTIAIDESRELTAYEIKP